MAFNASTGGRAAPMRPVSAGRLRSGARPTAALLVLLLALLVQGTVIQTHLHLARQAQAAADAPGDRAAQASQPDRTRPFAECAICQEAAMAGAYVLPPAAAVPAPWIAAPAVAAADQIAFALAASALGWRSRAPPR